MNLSRVCQFVGFDGFLLSRGIFSANFFFFFAFFHSFIPFDSKMSFCLDVFSINKGTLDSFSSNKRIVSI